MTTATQGNEAVTQPARNLREFDDWFFEKFPQCRDYLLNHVLIEIDAPLIPDVARVIDDEDLLGLNRGMRKDDGLRLIEMQPEAGRMVIHYFSPRLELEPIEKLAIRFPRAKISIVFANQGSSYEGFGAFENGMCIRSREWFNAGDGGEDDGGLKIVAVPGKEKTWAGMPLSKIPW